MQPRICGIDIETTGLDHAQDHITEIAWVVKEVGEPKALTLRSNFVLPPEEMWDSADYIKPNIEQLTKIKMLHLMSGRMLKNVLSDLVGDLIQHNVDYIVAHNGENFDRPFILGKSKALGKDFSIDQILENLPWVDTTVDCTYPEDCRHTNLTYLAAYHGFLNPFPHSALFDVMTMLRILDGQDFPRVAERAKSPWCVVRADVTYEQRDKAKKRRYYWETLGDKTYPKQWVKKVKECELEKEKAEADFHVIKLG